MATQIIRIGNRLAVEIPPDVAEEAALDVDQSVEWISRDSAGITLVRVPDNELSAQRKPLSLDEILQGLPEDAPMEELGWGPARRAEVW